MRALLRPEETAVLCPQFPLQPFGLARHPAHSHLPMTPNSPCHSLQTLRKKSPFFLSILCTESQDAIAAPYGVRHTP